MEPYLKYPMSATLESPHPARHESAAQAAGSARLRVTLSAAHSEAQLELLLQALAECWPLLGEGEDA